VCIVLISVIGPGSNSLRYALKAAGIPCEERPVSLRRGVIVAAGGRFLNITQAAFPRGALARVLHTWMNVRNSRRVMLTNDHGHVVHVADMTIEQIEQTLDNVKQIDAFDVKIDRK
jgi:hypothetical protein